MAQRARKPRLSPSEESSSSLSSPASSEYEESDSATHKSGGRKGRIAAVAGKAKRRAAIESDGESSTEAVVKRVRRGTKSMLPHISDFKFVETEAVKKTKLTKSDKGSHVEKVETLEIVETETTVEKAGAKAKPPQKPKAKRKTKEEKEREKMPLADRTVGCAFKIGAHVSSAGGVENAVSNALRIGANAFALFLKSQRKWESPAYKPENIKTFKKLTNDLGYDSRRHMLPHGSYLVNLAQFDKAKATQAYDAFIDDLKRAESLNIGLFNFHPGSTLGEPRKNALERVAKALNKAHKETKFIKTVLETMAGQGNVIGCKFEDLRDIIHLVEDKSRVGVCIDTCHSFSAGYDLRAPESYNAVMKEFDDVIGFKYLCALHLNDSKAPFNSHRDLHQNIGLGFLGLSAFRNVMNTTEFHGIPMVLETPLVNDDLSTWANEIKLLESLIGLKPDDPEFLKLEKEYADKGAPERRKVVEKLEEKEDKKAEKEAKKREREEKRAEKARLKEEKAKLKASKGKTKTLPQLFSAKRTIVGKTAEEDSDSELSELTDSGTDSDASSCRGKSE